MKRRKRRRSRSQRSVGPWVLPKGAFVLPDGSVVTESVTAPGKHGRRYRTTAIHLAEPNYELLARAFIRLAEQQLANERTAARKPSKDAGVQ